MRQPLRKSKKFTDGDRARALAFMLVALCSAGLGYLAVLHLDRSALFAPLSWYQTWIVMACSMGGVIALFLSGDRIGQSGIPGALRAATGTIWVTFIGALLGGSLALPIYGTMFGPFIITVTFLGAPILAMLWVFSFASVHMLLGIYQRERDSIFKPARMAENDHPESLRARIQSRYS